MNSNTTRASRSMIRVLIPTIAAATFLGTAAEAATYRTVVPAGSTVAFRYSQMGVTLDGKFKRFAATVDLDTAKPAAATGRIDIDLASIDAGSAEADDEVVGKTWLDVRTHPKASFVLETLKPTASSQYEASGKLTIKGRTKAIRVPVKVSEAGVLNGSFVLHRADFAVGEGMWAKFDVVANEVTVDFSFKLK